jgi:hypothetical protein
VIDVLDVAAGLWSLPSRIEQTKAHHGYRQIMVVAGGDLRIPELAPLLEPYQPVAEAWLSWIDPGGYVVPHRDQGPHHERWQLPIDSPLAPFRVKQWESHEVRNTTDRPRVHLVIDRAVIACNERNPFEFVDGPCRLLP